jgi:hypothetical protein
MFGLFKLVIDAAMALGLFYAGIKTQQNYPNLIAKIGGIWTWLKSVVPGL